MRPFRHSWIPVNWPRKIGVSLSPWPLVAAGLCSGLVSLAFVSPAREALNWFDPPKRLLWSGLTLALCLAWHQRSRCADKAAFGLAAALMAWMTVRTFARPGPAAELAVLFSWLLPTLLFVLALDMRRSRSEIRKLGFVLIGIGLVQSALMLLQRFGVDPVFHEATAGMDYAPGRMIGTIGYQNQAVDFLALCMAGIPMVVGGTLLRGLAFAPLWLLIGLTGNRGGILAFAVAASVSLVMAVRRNRVRGSGKRWHAYAVLIAATVFMIVGIARIPETGSRWEEALIGFRKSPAARSRLVMARVAMAMLAEKPVHGWGAGEYAMQYPDRLGDVLPAEKAHFDLTGVVYAREAHNDPLQFAVEFGFIGLVLLLALAALAFARIGKSDSGQRVGSESFAFVLTYMTVSALFSFPWQSAAAGPLAGFLLGWLWPTGPESTETGVSSGNRKACLVAEPALILLALVLLAWNATDAWLNMVVPSRLSMSGPVEAERALPRLAYRYHAVVGAAYARAGLYDRAFERLAHARRGYRDPLLWNNMGHVLSKTGQWEEAAEVYSRWVASGLNHANALSNLSVAFENTGQVDRAARALERKLALWPEASLDEITRLTVLQWRSGYSEKAYRTLFRYEKQWREADPKMAAQFENMAGGLALALGRREEAERWFRSALEKDPALESAARNLQNL